MIPKRTHTIRGPQKSRVLTFTKRFEARLLESHWCAALALIDMILRESGAILDYQQQERLSIVRRKIAIDLVSMQAWTAVRHGFRLLDHRGLDNALDVLDYAAHRLIGE